MGRFLLLTLTREHRKNKGMSIKKPKEHKSYLTSSSGRTLYGGVVILDTSEISDFADYGGLLYELKKSGVRDGDSFQVDNGGDLLMLDDVYNKCSHILKKFKVRPVNL